MGLNQDLPARDNGTQNIAYLRKRITFADNGLTVTVGALPEGAIIIKPISGVHVSVAFNGDTTNTLDIGPSNDTGTNLWATILALGTIGFIPLDEVVSNIVGSGQSLVQAKVVSTATATAGVGDIIVAFIVPTN